MSRKRPLDEPLDGRDVRLPNLSSLRPSAPQPTPRVDPAELNRMLLVAAERGQSQQIRRLREAGADVNARNMVGETALIRTALRGHVAATRLLLELGADVDATESEGRTPLMIAAFRGHVAVMSLLLDGGAFVDRVDTRYGWTALMYSTAHGQAGAYNLLVGAGADASVVSTSGETAQSLGVASGFLPQGGFLAPVLGGE